MSRKKTKRILCEDLSPTILSFRKSKHHNKVITIGKKQWERIGDSFLYDVETSLIKKYDEIVGSL